MHSSAPDRRGAGGRLASLAIRNPVTICMVFLSIVVMGLIAVTRVPLMLMPSLDAPILFIRADYFNATPSQVLESITQPIEEAVAAEHGKRAKGQGWSDYYKAQQEAAPPRTTP